MRRFLYMPVVEEFDPTQISGCVLWLDGTDQASMSLSGTDVLAWNDKSGNGNHWTGVPDGGGTYPQLVPSFINGKSAVANTTGTEHLTNSTISFNGDAPMTVIFILKRTADILWALLWRLKTVDTGKPHLYLSAATYYKRMVWYQTSASWGSWQTQHDNDELAINNPVKLGLFYDGSQDLSGWDVKVQGVSETLYSADVSNTGSSDNYLFGRGGSELYRGGIGEFIVYNKVISGAESAALDAWLLSKWAL